MTPEEAHDVRTLLRALVPMAPLPAIKAHEAAGAAERLYVAANRALGEDTLAARLGMITDAARALALKAQRDWPREGDWK